MVFLLLLINIFKNNLLNSAELFYNFYSEQLAQEQLEKILDTQKKWEWLA